MGLALVALLLVVHLGPEGMPDGLRRPCDERLPEGTVDTGGASVPRTSCRSVRSPARSRPIVGVRRRRQSVLFAEGDEQPGGEDGARSWQGLEEGEIGMALRALRAGSVDIGDSLQGDPELSDEGLHQERMGRDDTVIGGEGV